MTTEQTLPEDTLDRIVSNAGQYAGRVIGEYDRIVINTSYIAGGLSEANRALPLIDLLQNIQQAEYNANGESYLWKRIEDTLEKYFGAKQ